MNSNESLGNERLLFGDDPFIGGEMSTQENLNTLNDLLGDSFSFATDALYENATQPDNAFDGPPISFANGLHDEPGMFYDPYPEFVFDIDEDDANQYQLEVNNIMEENGTVHDELIESAVIETSHEIEVVSEAKVDQYINEVQDQRADVQPTGNDIGSQTEYYQDTESLKIVPVQKILGNKIVNKTTTTMQNNRHAPYEVSRNEGNRQKVLFPVKVSKVLPTTNRTNYPSARTIYNGSYQEAEDPLASIPEPTVAQVIKVPVRRTAMSDLVPRDTGSNHIRCTMCNSSFSTKLALEFHEVEKHTRVYAFKCRHCEDVFASLSYASVHIVTKHNKPIIPLYDKNILGHGLDINDKKSSQRRISGMICSFLSKHLAQLGLLTGLSQSDHAIVKQHAKKLYRPSPPPFKTKFTDHKNGPVDPQVEETATLNQLLKEEYIYGKSIYRVPVESIDQDALNYGHGQELAQLDPFRMTLFPMKSVGLDTRVFVRPNHTKPLPIGIQPQKKFVVKSNFVQPTSERSDIYAVNKSMDVASGYSGVQTGREVIASKAGITSADPQQTPNLSQMTMNNNSNSIHLYQ